VGIDLSPEGKPDDVLGKPLSERVGNAWGGSPRSSPAGGQSSFESCDGGGEIAWGQTSARRVKLSRHFHGILGLPRVKRMYICCVALLAEPTLVA
jgi:hypothetical protein